MDGRILLEPSEMFLLREKRKSWRKRFDFLNIACVLATVQFFGGFVSVPVPQKGFLQPFLRWREYLNSVALGLCCCAIVPPIRILFCDILSVLRFIFY